MHRSGLTLLLVASLSAFFLAGCGKKDDPKPAATTTPQAPTPQAAVPASDPASLREACKKTFATNCAVPCERKAELAEKDPARLKTLQNTCMRTCLEQAEAACKQAGVLH